MMLDIHNLTCGYGGGFSLKDINMRVEKGELMGIIGPNGSGKTTLFRAVTRILKPERGSVMFEGRDIRRIPVKELSTGMAIVSQGAEAGSMTLEEFVLLGRTPYFNRFQFLETSKDLSAAEKAMKLTGTYGLRDRPMSRMSGGERQLGLIARALAQEPRLLLLDEPTTHLDIAHQVVIMDLIKKLNRDLGITIVVVLHDLNLASEYCGRITLMKNGNIYKTGTPGEVLTYQIIEEAYNTVVVVEKNPVSSRPYVLVVPEEERNKKNIKYKDR
ncbi:MAG: ABC transporter ATP-binding protein [Candidatus Omnitrophica bacterium]|nr:ABC transporter ATP-binding protein [Candidatus Omnitrophota bacterium]